MTYESDNYKDEMGNDFRTFILPIETIRPGEDMSNKVTPDSIDDYPIVIYADGEIQDGHHRYKYLLENGATEVRVILAHDIDEDWAVEDGEWIEGLYKIYCS